MQSSSLNFRGKSGPSRRLQVLTNIRILLLRENVHLGSRSGAEQCVYGVWLHSLLLDNPIPHLDQLSLLRSLVSEDAASVNAVDVVCVDIAHGKNILETPARTEQSYAIALGCVRRPSGRGRIFAREWCGG